MASMILISTSQIVSRLQSTIDTSQVSVKRAIRTGTQRGTQLTHEGHDVGVAHSGEALQFPEELGFLAHDISKRT